MTGRRIPGILAGAVRAAAATGVVVVVAGCGGHAAPTTPTSTATGRPDRRRPPEAGAVLAALAPLPGGGLRAGELTTGIIRDVLTPTGAPTTGAAGRTLLRLAVSTGGQRGLLGLTVDPAGRTFAAFTSTGPGQRLVVEQVLPGPRRRVWTGPPSTDLADGGHLDRLGDGRLVIGIGDLQDPARTPRADSPNGKLLTLDPDGPPGQRPGILSRGWNNPFAFARLAADAVLVADNAPGRRPERIGRGDAQGGAPRAVTELRGRIAASGLAVLGPRRIAVCGVRSGRLTRFDQTRAGGRWQPAGDLGPCAFGVARLAGGRLAVSTATGVRVVAP